MNDPGINQQTASEPSVRDILAGINSAPAAAPSRNPIGVPKDYVARVPREPSRDMIEGHRQVGGTNTVAPRYFDGDEWRPANQPPDKIAEQQRSLVDAGLLSEKEYHEEMGSWGTKTVDAYARLLQNANATGKSADDAMVVLQAATNARGGPAKDPSKVPTPLVVRLTNPDEIRGLANDIAVRKLGHTLSPVQLESHVAAWQQTERLAAEEQYRMTGSGLPGGSGGTVTEPMGAHGLEAKIAEENPGDAQSYDAIGRYNQFASLLKGTLG